MEVARGSHTPHVRMQRRPIPACVFGAPQTRADVCARQALGLHYFDRFAVAVLGQCKQPQCPQLDALSFSTAEAALAILSIATDTLSMRITESVASGLLQAAFSLGLVAWPEAFIDNVDDPTCAAGLAEHRLARIFASELAAEAAAERELEVRGRAEFADHTSVARSAVISIANDYGSNADIQLLTTKHLPSLQRLPRSLLAPRQHLHRRPHRVCLRCHCSVGAFGPMPLCAGCFQASTHLLSLLMRSCALDLADWKKLEASSEASPDGARFDFLNEYGRHALTADVSSRAQRLLLLLLFHYAPFVQPPKLLSRARRIRSGRGATTASRFLL